LGEQVKQLLGNLKQCNTLATLAFVKVENTPGMLALLPNKKKKKGK